MAKRIKALKLPEIETRAEAVQVAEDVALLEIGRLATVAEMNERLERVRAEYAPGLDDTASQIQQKRAVLESWADRNPAEFGKAKSLDLGSAKIGYRTGNWKVEACRKWTFAKALAAMVESGDWEEFIREVPEINKEELITQRDVLPEAYLAEVGLKITRDEDFYVESKIEDPGKGGGK